MAFPFIILKNAKCNKQANWERNWSAHLRFEYVRGNRDLWKMIVKMANRDKLVIVEVNKQT